MIFFSQLTFFTQWRDVGLVEQAALLNLNLLR